jgi:glutamine synthetase
MEAQLEAATPETAGDRPPEPRADEIAAALARVRSLGAKYADFWFTELSGRPWRITLAADKLDEAVFRSGIVLDGRSVGGSWEGLITLFPDPAAIFSDPSASAPTAALICDVGYPPAREGRAPDARRVLTRADALLRAATGAEVSLGVEVELFLIDAGEPAPEETLREFLRTLNGALGRAGIPGDWFRIGPAHGQGRAQMRPAAPLRAADQVQIYKHAARSLASSLGCTASFLAKPLPGPGSAAMLVHHALWKQGRNMFHDAEGWACASESARHFAGGLLRHAPALLALCAPTVNSYRRLLPGSEAPTELVLSRSKAAAVCRVPPGSTGTAEASRRVKFCAADPSSNPYLALAGMLLAGLDGLENKIEPSIESPAVGRLPSSLEEALDALESDSGFLLRGGAFSAELLRSWSAERWESQVRQIRPRPHPEELRLEERA